MMLAGGISNAIPELAKDTKLELISSKCNLFNRYDYAPMELWCNESQERYVFSIPEEKLPA